MCAVSVNRLINRYQKLICVDSIIIVMKRKDKLQTVVVIQPGEGVLKVTPTEERREALRFIRFRVTQDRKLLRFEAKLDKFAFFARPGCDSLDIWPKISDLPEVLAKKFSPDGKIFGMMVTSAKDFIYHETKGFRQGFHLARARLYLEGTELDTIGFLSDLKLAKSVSQEFRGTIEFTLICIDNIQGCLKASLRVNELHFSPA